MSVRPAKTQISLGIRPIWSKSSLCAQWVAMDPQSFFIYKLLSAIEINKYLSEFRLSYVLLIELLSFPYASSARAYLDMIKDENKL